MLKDGSGVSGRVIPPVIGRSWLRVAVSYCTGEGKACQGHPSSDRLATDTLFQTTHREFSAIYICPEYATVSFKGSFGSGQDQVSILGTILQFSIWTVPARS